MSFSVGCDGRRPTVHFQSSTWLKKLKKFQTWWKSPPPWNGLYVQLKSVTWHRVVKLRRRWGRKILRRHAADLTSVTTVSTTTASRGPVTTWQSTTISLCISYKKVKYQCSNVIIP